MPQIALEGTIDLEEALVLDDVSDLAAIHAAHEQASPSSSAHPRSRESTPRSRSARSPARLVADPSFLELDLPQLTYG